MKSSATLLACLLILAASLEGVAQTVHFVTSPFDSGSGTFRQVVEDALDGDTIRFTVSGAITLTSANISYAKDLVIEGPGPDQLTLSGNMLNVPLVITGGSTRISGLTIQSGHNQYGSIPTGGGMGFAGDSLWMTDVHFTGCSQTGIGGFLRFGGGLRASGTYIRITACEFAGNTVMMGTGDSGQGSGGGAAILSDDFVIQDCLFDGNTVRGRSDQLTAYGKGGGLFVQGMGRVVGCTFNGNSAQGLTVMSSYPDQDAYAQGGGLCIDGQSVVELENCSVLANTLTCGATEDRGWQGAGIYIDRADVAIRNCVIEGNSATLSGNSSERNEGGGIHMRDGWLALTDCEISNNTAKEGNGIFHTEGFDTRDRQVLDLQRTRLVGGTGLVESGAIHSTSATAIYMQDVEFSDNESRGLYYRFGDSLRVDRCLFHENRGGVWLSSMTTNENILMNSTFHRNAAAQGGALFANGNTTVQLVNCTFVDDSLTSSESDGRELHLSNSTALLRNCLLSATPAPDAVAFGGFEPVALSAGGNVCEDGSLNSILILSSDVTEVDPGLGTFADHGGFTRSWSLAAESTCIDRGGADTLSVDQRGFVRDDNSDTGAHEGGAIDPVINLVLGPTEGSVCIGQSLVIEVEATSAIDLMYQWQLNGEDIDGATFATYTATANSLEQAIYSCTITNGFNTVVSDALTLVVDLCTGLQPVDTTAIVAYPVPFTDQLVVRWTGPIEQVILRNALGQVVQRLPATSVDQVTMETGSLPAGYYILEVTGKQGRLGVKKVIKLE